MIPESQYRLSKRLLWFSRVMLILAAVMLVWIAVDFFMGKDTLSNLAAVIIDVALFGSLVTHHKRQIRMFEEQNGGSK